MSSGGELIDQTKALIWQISWFLVYLVSICDEVVLAVAEGKVVVKRCGRMEMVSESYEVSKSLGNMVVFFQDESFVVPVIVGTKDGALFVGGHFAVGFGGGGRRGFREEL